MLDRRDLLGLGLAAGAMAALPARAAANAGPPQRMPLWPRVPEPAPPGLGQTYDERSKNPAILDRALTGVTAPWLDHFPAVQGNGAAIIAIPGGGYRHMAWDKEALDIAAWFAARGIAGFALAYRLPHDGWRGGLDTPLADAQRAVRLIRSRAGQLGIDPQRIAVVGFSAGGHLTANLAAQFGRETYAPQDVADRLSARPDLAAPIYPATLIKQLVAAAPAGEPLFGRVMDDAEMARHSPHLQVPADAPPHFLVHAEDDPLVGPEHTLALRAALKDRKIPVETHLFDRGGHGFGIRNTAGLPVADWPERLIAFGRTTGWIR